MGLTHVNFTLSLFRRLNKEELYIYRNQKQQQKQYIHKGKLNHKWSYCLPKQNYLSIHLNLSHKIREVSLIHLNVINLQQLQLTFDL